METIVYWETLMKLAKALGKARIEGNPEKIEIAQKEHDAYKEICLKADKMILPEY